MGFPKSRCIIRQIKKQNVIMMINDHIAGGYEEWEVEKERKKKKTKKEKKLSRYIIRTLFIIILPTENPVIKGKTMIKNIKKHLLAVLN